MRSHRRARSVTTGSLSLDRGRTGQVMTSESVARPIAVLVEDDAALRELERELIEEAGYVTWALSGPPTPHDLVRLSPDVVVLDLLLNGGPEGLEWLRSLAEDRLTAGVPVVVCTGAANLANREADRLTNLAQAVLLKPFDVEAFLETVQAVATGTPVQPGHQTGCRVVMGQKSRTHRRYRTGIDN